MVTLDLAMDLVKGMVLGENRSYMTDTHFAELEGIREESTLLLRNFYKVISTPKIFLLFFSILKIAFLFYLMNALVYVDIDQGILYVKMKSFRVVLLDPSRVICAKFKSL